MSDGFNEGLMGMPTGSAQNFNGLMYNEAMKEKEKDQPKKIVECLPTEARWDERSECFTPKQVHINMLEISIFLNFLLIMIFMIMKIGKRI